jgi:16S rRNA (cytidine1402-2'-O)-methyltransferase
VTHTLYIVPTPIGNLEDITLRALRILREVSLIAAEDTRTTARLLQHYAITTPLTSYHEHNKLTKLDALFAALETGSVALVSDAGTPGINDPGYELIRAAIARGIRVEPLPGPSAVITALVGSGLPTDGFVFIGFLPRTERARAELFAALRQERRTTIAYESPNRLVESLSALCASLGVDHPVCVARELTKIHEEFQRGPAGAVLAHYQAHPPRGEIVLVIGGAAETAHDVWDEARLRDALLARLRAGMRLRDAAPLLAAESGWERKRVYELGLTLRHGPQPDDDSGG